MSGGGYVEEAVPTPANVTTSRKNASEVLLALTPRQETRLCAHLDDRLLGLERDERKQAFKSIPALLDRMYPLLHLILQIPPRTPWSDLRISYLLNLTGFLATYLTSLPLLPPQTVRRHGKEAEIEAGRVISDLLGFLDEVEQGWLAVLGGQGWVMNEILEDERRTGHGVAVDFSGSVGQTERTRLRSIIISSRAKFTAWARTYGHFPSSVQSDTNPGARQTVGCNGDEDFDPDPPTSYSVDAANGSKPSSGVGAWEDRILGLWNTVLELLTDQDLGQGRGR